MLRAKFVLAAALAAATGFATASSITVYPTFIDTSQNRAAVYIKNSGGAPIYVEAQLKKEASDVDAAVFPPAARIQPGKKQVFRLVLPPTQPENGSVRYWRLFVSEVSEKSDEKQAGVANELAFSLPVFQTAKDAKYRLLRDGDGVRNAGNKQVIITRIGDKSEHIWLLPGDRVAAPAGAPIYSGDLLLDAEETR